MTDLIVNIKVLILGDKATGKTCLINKLFKKENKNVYEPTIGPNFNLYIKKINQEYNSHIFITELGSNSKGNINLIKSLLFKSNYLIFVLDLTSKTSIDYCNFIYSKINRILDKENIKVCVILNKNDLINIKENVNLNDIKFSYEKLQNTNYKDDSLEFISKIINLELERNYKNINIKMENLKSSETKLNNILISKKAKKSNCKIF